MSRPFRALAGATTFGRMASAAYAADFDAFIVRSEARSRSKTLRQSVQKCVMHGKTLQNGPKRSSYSSKRPEVTSPVKAEGSISNCTCVFCRVAEKFRYVSEDKGQSARCGEKKVKVEGSDVLF